MQKKKKQQQLLYVQKLYCNIIDEIIDIYEKKYLMKYKFYNNIMLMLLIRLNLH